MIYLKVGQTVEISCECVVRSCPFVQLKWEFSEELKKFQEQVQHQLDQAEET